MVTESTPTEESVAAPDLVFVEHWSEELKERVPTP